MERLGCRTAVTRTAARGDAERLAADAARGGFDVIVAAGGDGTVNEVVNGLAGCDMPLAILPCGTANVLALETLMPVTSRTLAAMIVDGPVCRLNLGLANGRRFVTMAGVGFDAHVVRGVDPAVKRVFGKGAYLLQFLYTLARFPRRRYRVKVDGIAYEAASVVIANGRYYGGRFSCARDACLTDACLDVCLFERSGPINVLRYAAALARGRLNTLPDFQVVRGLDVRIDGADGDPVQCDGDIAGALPLVARAEGLRLPLVVAG
jgi:YegS/Rv2252/BmrU family lipid kinase